MLSFEPGLLVHWHIVYRAGLRVAARLFGLDWRKGPQAAQEQSPGDGMTARHSKFSRRKPLKRFRRSGARRRFPSLLEWRNWQTHGTQNPATLRSCGFDPHLQHQPSFLDAATEPNEQAGHDAPAAAIGMARALVAEAGPASPQKTKSPDVCQDHPSAPAG